MTLTWKIGKKAFSALILTIVSIAFISIIMPNPSAQPPPPWTRLGILPVDNTFNATQTPPGSVFTINATVTNITDLQNWQITLTWNSSLLNLTDSSNVWLPTDHVFSKSGKSMVQPVPTIEPGYLQWGCTYTNGAAGTQAYWTFNGTGTLCQINMTILAPPVSSFPGQITCNLTLINPVDDTFLLDGAGHDIPFTIDVGHFTYFDYLAATLSPSGTVLVNHGETVQFTASAVNGSLPYRYQWFFKYPNGTEIEATEAEDLTSWTCYPINETGSHTITINVTDSANAKATAHTTVKIRSLSVTLTPSTPVIDVGGTKTFTAIVSGGVPPYKIQWYRNGTEIMAVRNMTDAQFTFTQVGTETIKVNVTDSESKNSWMQTDALILTTPTVTLKVTPKAATFYTNQTKVGDKIILNITVQNVNQLENWQINVTWDPTLLKYSSISRPTDDVFADAVTAGKTLVQAGPNVGTGSVLYGWLVMNDVEPFWTFNGTGTLCQLELQIIMQPAPQSSCNVTLVEKYTDTFLLKHELPNTIPFSPDNATYTYVLVPYVTHQVLGSTVITYTNTSIIANSIVPNTTEISVQLFNITGAPGTGAFVNFTLPRELIHDSWKVYLDGADVTSKATITSDNTNTYVYLEFTFGDTGPTIKIVGSWIKPEQIHMLVTAFLATSLIAVVFARTRLKKKWLK